MLIKDEVEQAKKLGLNKFVSATKCRKCEGVLRYALSGGSCVKCKGGSSKKDYFKNKAARKATRKQWGINYREYLNLYKMAYREKIREAKEAVK